MAGSDQLKGLISSVIWVHHRFYICFIVKMSCLWGVQSSVFVKFTLSWFQTFIPCFCGGDKIVYHH